MLGLALLPTTLKDDEPLRQKVLEKSKLALDWIVDEKTKNLFGYVYVTSDSVLGLMQAIEEWTSNLEFKKDNYINFVLNDAQTT